MEVHETISQEGPLARRARLAQAWARHCDDDAGHVMAVDGGNARFDTNVGDTFIMCLAPRCKWVRSIDDV